MYHRMALLMPIFLLFILIFSINAKAEDNAVNTCAANDKSCILEQMLQNAQTIENKLWRDQTYREIAKTLAAEGQFEKAVSLIEKIQTPDTKAMTIRGIGMELAAHNYAQEKLDQMFSTLRNQAEEIKHPPSYAIALTYIAMGQAFAGDNDGAWKTASEMENDALRHKAYGETAEIQAEQGDYNSARISIEKIESVAFRNKAYSIISKIFSDAELYADAYKAANSISNPYKKAQALQYLLDVQVKLSEEQ